MKAQFIYEKFSDQSDPIKDMGIGMNVYQQYLDIIKKNPELKIFKEGKEMHHFRAYLPDNPNEIYIAFNREHPMSGYGGRTSRLKFWGDIKFIKGEYRVKCYKYDDSPPNIKLFDSFKTLKEALKYVIPEFQSILSYYSEYDFGK